ncbi:unnamed protein product [Strongylus vulgaris]|uniref:Uncharacterized protein n=1 Tax=Strongylus vulgaris TaxID=40348 RepID=A0A3P7LNK1_STRVU|nr:unnamed protein product [Strongylus vulgaris]
MSIGLRNIVVGAARTGKSSLVGRFLDADFEDRYIPTIENFYRKLYKIKSEVYQLDIIDCSGNDPFPAARKLSYISGDMFLLVSSVDNADSVAAMLDVTEKEVAEQVEQATGSHEAFVTCSAANNLNIDKAFAKLFTLNKCPKHMNPELHKMLRNELSADGETGRRHILRRMRSRFSREHDDCLTT